jgi:1-acyl-sn-glycerol-3-phosphate acyltransferase
MIMKKICHALLFNVMGWHVDVTVPHRDKCIICVAPHTSNWDFILGELYYTAIGRKASFLMKKEWFFWPMGYIFRQLGGFPVYRSKKTSMTDMLAERIKETSHLKLAVTPEGTRSKVETWKRGFYFIALKAGVPIQLYDLDYKHKTIRCTLEIIPSGDVEADMKIIMDYYKHSNAKYPHKFAIEALD